MVNTLTQSPIQWLQDIERRAKQRAKGLPRHEKVEPIWRGIGFRLGKTFLVTPINDIREILPYPTQIARVPGAKSWVKGLANIRGLLLPVIDLSACLEGKPINLGNRTRMLVINQTGVLSAGLLVDEVLGIKHFPEHMKEIEAPNQEAWVAPFTNGLFIFEETHWIIFDIHKLVGNSLFLNAAL